MPRQDKAKLDIFRIAVTGGGTGGHIYPIISVVEAIYKLTENSDVKIEVRFLGNASKEYRKLFEEKKVKVGLIIGSKIRRYLSPLNLLDLIKFKLSLWQACWKLFWYMPDVVFSKGGPGSLPVVIMAWFYRIPIIIHESDTVPSLTTKIAAKFAKKIAISFESTADYFPNKEVMFVGNPIREEFSKETDQNAAKESLGFNKRIPLVLVLGGSQGATRINSFILDAVTALLENFQVLHQTGIKNYETVKKEFAFLSDNLPEETKQKYRFEPFLMGDIKTAYAAADLVVARAGSGLISEIAAMGKPAILIPLPESASDHQKKNAYEYKRTGAADVIEEANFLPHVFVNEIQQLLENKEKLTKMAAAAKKFGKPNAALNIASETLKLGAKPYEKSQS